jgi:ketosteroid isomerase-like protein
MSNHGRALIALLILFASVAFTAAEELRPAMERANAGFLEAFNRPNPAGFAELYAPDAILVFSGLPPKTGSEAITQFWESRIRAGARDHTFEIVSAWADGKYAFQLAKAGVQLVTPTGEKIAISGYTVRISNDKAMALGRQRCTCSTARAGPE